MQNQQPQKMNDQEMLTDLLTQEKFLVGTYGNTVVESSCTNLRQILKDNLSAGSNDQFEIYSQMRQRGWYMGKDAPTNEVMQAKQHFAQMLQQAQ